MNTASVTVFGGSGYSGLELTRLLARHAGVQVAAVTSDRWAGKTVDGISYCSHDQGLEKAKSTDIALLATPAEASLELAPKLLAANVRVIDLSGAFRLRDLTLYPRFYGFTHSAPKLNAEAVYGLPELNREQQRTARLVANPGCYATAAALSIAPLVKAGLVKDLVITAASGVSGAGRKATEEFSFMELSQDFRAYKVLKHQHTPEISQTLGGANVVFTPHLLPLQRGILSTTVAKVTSKTHVEALLHDAYAREPFMRVLPNAEAVHLAAAARTNNCLIGATVEDDTLVVVTALDNLLKGAASQAVQNLNLMLGLTETEGLKS
jgi:N-acetyl-gamma-glutamyl-phosphate reductase